MFAAVALLPSAALAAGPAVDARWRVVSQPAGDSGRTELALDVDIEKGWHVNASDPDRPYLIPTSLQVDPLLGARVEQLRYPDAVLRRLAFAGDTPLRLYEGSFTIVVRIEGNAPARVSGKLRYQACNEETCLPPKTLPVALTLERQAPAADPSEGPALFSPVVARGSSLFEGWLRDLGLPVTLAIAAALGLALNLTPCVYPLVSVTIGYFGGQTRGSSGQVWLLACAYVLGIAITFAALGVSAALSGGLFGAALQRPVILAGIAALLIVLAAGNFGLYQFRIPATLTQRAGKAYAGIAGAFLMGLTMGVVAAPCVGPTVVGLLLFVASHQDPILGFALFFALALGMGLPYLGLAVAAGAIERLPRSGEWLAWMEHLFGFLLLAMALYFLGPLVGPDVVATATAVLLAIAGIYLGFIDPAGRSLRTFAVAKRTLGVVAIAAAVWLALPRPAESAIAWQPFSPAALREARDAGRPAIVDFTASWCLPCRENDAVTFTDPRIGAEAERFAMLRADVTEVTPEMEEWMARYEVLGVPTIIFYGGSGAEDVRAVGFVDPDKFLQLMRERT